MNLRVLTLVIEDAVGYKPESISGLQKLERLTLRHDMPGLPITAELARSHMASHDGSGIAPTLQVAAFDNLATNI